MKQSEFPPGWTDDLIQEVIRHYETQTEDEAVAEDEGYLHSADTTSIEIPSELVPLVRDIIARFENLPNKQQGDHRKRPVANARR